MNFCRSTILLTAAVLLFGSCSAPRQISYFQDQRPGNGQMTIPAPKEIKIQSKDKLSIVVNSQDWRLTNLFNLPVVSQQIGQESASGGGSGRGVSGYTVDSDGNIDFPVLGHLCVEGMTREQIAAFIKRELVLHDLIKDPVVTVEFLNLSINILGEVNSPGRYNIDKDRYTILDALSEAGDLTIYGKRDNIMVLRNENGKRRSYNINLCSADNLFASPAYYLQQNDVVYVEPNKTRARQSTINENNAHSISFWVSLASMMSTIFAWIIR